MRLIMLGPPGAGKGTQAKKIAVGFGVPHISTGEMFRSAVKQQTEMGKKASEFMKKGLLVPDEIVIGIVDERLRQPDVKRGFVLDGFPRNISQAENLKGITDDLCIKIEKVININVEKNELIQRFTGRRICPKCGATFNIKYNPPKEPGVCQRCGEKLIMRPDDTRETVIKRLEVYEKETAPLIKYYEEKGLLVNVDGGKTIESVYDEIMDLLRSGAHDCD
ncbi:MAG: adenylate kinase [Thermoanaerobacterales bacterium]|nr:adenylate kinase [Thermoanaerobacterales bacterium]